MISRQCIITMGLVSSFECATGNTIAQEPFDHSGNADGHQTCGFASAH
jgi:hypothetical protein